MRFILLILLFFLSSISVAQQFNTTQVSFEKGIQYFENGQYQEAVGEFKSNLSPVSQLFLAKSYYALGQHRDVDEITKRLSNHPDEEIKLEATYLNSLILIDRKEFAEALNIISNVLTGPFTVTTPIISDLKTLQHQIVSYLSYKQRLSAIRKVSDPSLRKDIVVDYYSIYPSNLAVELLNELYKIDSSLNLTEHIRKATSQELLISNSFARSYPNGNIINMGVLLPSFQQNLSEKSVSRGLFNGLLIAADEFNRMHTDRKIRLHYIDSDEIKNNLRSGLQQAKEDFKLDVIIGPLYSEQVIEISNFVERLDVPFLAPLANTFEINKGHDLIYQINPSFESRGRQTANLAFNSLQLQKFGVMTEKDSHGEIDANAFADEITKLGGEITYFFAEDFASTGYYVGDHTPWFANDQMLVDTTLYVIDTLDAVYFPFTGEVAGTLLNLTLTGLEQFNPEYIILSNDEMMYIEHSQSRLLNLKMMYTSSSNVQEGTQEAMNFRFDYQNRSGTEPNTFSYLGYDIGKFYLNTISKIANPDDLTIYLPYLPTYNGLSTSINFRNGNSNDALNLFELTVDGVQTLNDR